MKRTILPTLFLTLLISRSFAKSIPGQRPDLAPSRIRSLITSIETEIVEQSRVVKAARETWQTTPYNKRKGIWGFRYNARESAKTKYDEVQDKLKDLLASTPSDSNEVKGDLVKDSHAAATSNAEIIELRLSIDNLRNVVRQYRKDFLKDTTNLELATDYYNAHVECLASLVEMHDEFIQNVDVKYEPVITGLIKKFEGLEEESQNRLKSDLSDTAETAIEKLKANQRMIIQKLEEARACLPKQKIWAAHNLTRLTEALMVARLANKTLLATKEAKSIIKDLGDSFDELSFSPPPLIIFDIDISDFKNSAFREYQ